MANSEIDRIKMVVGGTTHQQITEVGLRSTPYFRSVADIVELIRSKRDTFYISDFFSGMPIPIGVVREIGRTPYLRAFNNGEWTDDLLLVRRA